MTPSDATSFSTPLLASAAAVAGAGVTTLLESKAHRSELAEARAAQRDDITALGERLFTLFFRLALIQINQLAPKTSPTCFIIYGHDSDGQNKQWTDWLECHLTLAGIHLKTDRDTSKQAQALNSTDDFHQTIESIGRGTRSDIEHFIWPGLDYQHEKRPLDYILVCGSNALYDKYVKSAEGRQEPKAVVYFELQALAARQKSATKYAPRTVIFFTEPAKLPNVLSEDAVWYAAGDSTASAHQLLSMLVHRFYSDWKQEGKAAYQQLLKLVQRLKLFESQYKKGTYAQVESLNTFIARLSEYEHQLLQHLDNYHGMGVAHRYQPHWPHVFTKLWQDWLALIPEDDLLKIPEVPNPINVEQMRALQRETLLRAKIDALKQRYDRQAVMPIIGGELGETRSIDDTTFTNLALVVEDLQLQQEEGAREMMLNATKEAQTSASNKPDPVIDVERYHVLSSWELLHKPQQAMALEELWKPSEIKLKVRNAGKDANNENVEEKTITLPAPQKILVSGQAGIGKTTLCGNLVKKWGEGQLWPEFSVVLWISLRNLLDVGHYPKPLSGPGRYDLKTLVLSECFGCTPEKVRDADISLHQTKLSLAQQESLWEALVERKAQLLFVCDGYDEIAGYAESHPYLAAAIDELLSQPYVLLTSRPQAVANHAGLFGPTTDRNTIRRVVTVGFTDENIEAYLTQQGTPALTAYLKANSNAWGLAHTPINLALFCRLAQGVDDPAVLFGQDAGLSQLYEQVVKMLFRWSLQKQGVTDLPDLGLSLGNYLQEKGQLLPMLWWLGRYALTGLETRQLVLGREVGEQTVAYLREEVINAVDNSYALDLAGLKHFIRRPSVQGALRGSVENPLERFYQLMEQSGLVRRIPGKSRHYTFIHLTLQEFCAAWYIAQGYRHDFSRHYISQIKTQRQLIKQLIAEYAYEPRWSVVWWFVAGMLRDVPELAASFIADIATVRSDVSGLRALPMLVRCMNESGLFSLSLDNRGPKVSRLIEY